MESTNSPYTPGDEGGAEDNRLSLNPNDPKWKDMVAAWEDGQEYDVSGRIRQISPGEYEVVTMKAAEGAQADEETPAEDATAGEEAEPSPGEVETMGNMSPAAAAVMARRKRT